VGEARREDEQCGQGEHCGSDEQHGPERWEASAIHGGGMVAPVRLVHQIQYTPPADAAAPYASAMFRFSIASSISPVVL
jgi:hypothetical protein